MRFLKLAILLALILDKVVGQDYCVKISKAGYNSDYYNGLKGDWTTSTNKNNLKIYVHENVFNDKNCENNFLNSTYYLVPDYLGYLQLSESPDSSNTLSGDTVAPTSCGTKTIQGCQDFQVTEGRCDYAKLQCTVITSVENSDSAQNMVETKCSRGKFTKVKEYIYRNDKDEQITYLPAFKQWVCQTSNEKPFIEEAFTCTRTSYWNTPDTIGGEFKPGDKRALNLEIKTGVGDESYTIGVTFYCDGDPTYNPTVKQTTRSPTEKEIYKQYGISDNRDLCVSVGAKYYLNGVYSFQKYTNDMYGKPTRPLYKKINQKGSCDETLIYRYGTFYMYWLKDDTATGKWWIGKDYTKKGVLGCTFNSFYPNPIQCSKWQYYDDNGNPGQLDIKPADKLTVSYECSTWSCKQGIRNEEKLQSCTAHVNGHYTKKVTHYNSQPVVNVWEALDKNGIVIGTIFRDPLLNKIRCHTGPFKGFDACYHLPLEEPEDADMALLQKTVENSEILPNQFQFTNIASQRETTPVTLYCFESPQPPPPTYENANPAKLPTTQQPTRKPTTNDNIYYKYSFNGQKDSNGNYIITDNVTPTKTSSNPDGPNPSGNPDGPNPSGNPDGPNSSGNPDGTNPSGNPDGTNPSGPTNPPAQNPDNNAGANENDNDSSGNLWWIILIIVLVVIIAIIVVAVVVIKARNNKIQQQNDNFHAMPSSA